MRRATVGTEPSIHHRDAVAAPRTLSQQSQRDVVDYIRTMTTELNAMAEGADLQLLAYFLDMARMEADNIARQERLIAAPRATRP